MPWGPVGLWGRSALVDGPCLVPSAHSGPACQTQASSVSPRLCEVSVFQSPASLGPNAQRPPGVGGSGRQSRPHHLPLDCELAEKQGCSLPAVPGTPGIAGAGVWGRGDLRATDLLSRIAVSLSGSVCITK